MQIQCQFAGSDSGHKPKWCVHNSNWQPGCAPPPVEQATKKVQRHINLQLQQSPNAELNPRPCKIKQLCDARNSRESMVMLTDKNPGPAIMARCWCVNNIVRTHPLNKRNHKHLTETEATASRNRTVQQVIDLATSFLPPDSEDGRCFHC